MVNEFLFCIYFVCLFRIFHVLQQHYILRLAYMTKGCKKLEFTQIYNYLLLLSFCRNLELQADARFDDKSPVYNAKGEIALAQKNIDLLHLLFEDQDFGVFHYALVRAHYRIARILVSQAKNRTKALENL